MTTAVMTGSQYAIAGPVISFFKGVSTSYTLAKQYEHLFSLSDADLAGRGLTRKALKQRFLADASSI